MRLEELDTKYGLYKTIDLKTDSRISVFTKAGSNVLLFGLAAIGYFLANEQLLFPYKNTPLYVLQLALVLVAIMVYSFFHDLIHYLFAKTLHIKLNLKFRFGFPYIEYVGDIEKNRNYYLMLLGPFMFFFITLTIIQVFVALYAHDWFWLCYIIIIQNFVVSIDDFAQIIYTCKYKNSYLQLTESAINIYLIKNKFKELRNKEKEKIQARIDKQNAYQKKLQEIKSKNTKTNKDDIDQDLDDLSKLDS